MLTKLTDASAARARISAHETTPGQAFSNAVLMLSTTLKPRAEFMFGRAFFSLWMVDVPSSRSDPSQPCMQKTQRFQFNSLYSNMVLSYHTLCELYIIYYVCGPHIRIIRDYKRSNSHFNTWLALLLYVCETHTHEPNPFLNMFRWELSDREWDPPTK